jgi:hypothetical protein
VLLKLLWVDDIQASRNQLAHLAKAAYSATYAELEAMASEGLVTSVRKGKADVYSKNSKYYGRAILLALLEKPKFSPNPAKNLSDLDVQLNLVKFGAPLGVGGIANVDLRLEETLVETLLLARRDATVTRVLPVVIAMHKDKINFSRLEFLAREQKALSILGFFLDLTGSLAKCKKLHNEALKLKDLRRKKLENFFINRKVSRFEEILNEKHTPPIARSWLFLLNIGMDSFESLYRKNMN